MLPLLIPVVATAVNINSEEPNRTTSFAAAILERSNLIPKKGSYMNTRFIPPGSVIVESLFSSVSHIFNNRRLSTTPVHIEEQIFLKANNYLWNKNSFVKVQLNLEEENKPKQSSGPIQQKLQF